MEVSCKKDAGSSGIEPPDVKAGRLEELLAYKTVCLRGTVLQNEDPIPVAADVGDGVLQAVLRSDGTGGVEDDQTVSLLVHPEKTAVRQDRLDERRQLRRCLSRSALAQVIALKRVPGISLRLLRSGGISPWPPPD